MNRLAVKLPGLNLKNPVIPASGLRLQPMSRVLEILHHAWLKHQVEC